MGVAQARKGKNAGLGGTDGDAPRRQRDRGVVEVARDRGVPGSVVSCGGRRRWWPAPGALVNGGEVRSRGNGGSQSAEWHDVRCLRGASRACSACREGDSARAHAKGTERRAMGWWAALLKCGSVAWGREERGGVSVGASTWRRENEERGGLMWRSAARGGR
jgi:hypothetical protein